MSKKFKELTVEEKQNIIDYYFDQHSQKETKIFFDLSSDHVLKNILSEFNLSKPSALYLRKECPICKKLIRLCNFDKHFISHETNPEYHTKIMQHVTHDGLNCIYCGKLCKNKNSLAQHECRCKENPNHIAIIGNLIPHKAWNKGLTKETDERVRQNGLSVQKTFKEKGHPWQGRKLTTEHKEKISNSCLEKSKQGLWHKSLAKDMHYKYNGIDLDGQWEVKYAQWLDSNNIKWIRPSERFAYIFKNKVHYYTPDFYLIDSNEYVEIKGYKTAKDIAKWTQFPKDKNLIVLLETQLKDLGII